MAKKKSTSPRTYKTHKEHVDGAIPLIAVLSVIVIAVMVLTSVSRNLEVKNELTAEQTRYEELRSRGFNPDPVSVRTINIGHSWQTNNLSYNVRAAYVTPDIADYGDKRIELEIGTNNKFLVLEVDIADVRAQGVKREANVQRYLNLRMNGRAVSAVSVDNLTLGPRQNSTVYVIYVVPNSVSDFTLSSGVAGNTKLTALEFADATVEAKQGVFLTTQGYSPEFPQE